MRNPEGNEKEEEHNRGRRKERHRKKKKNFYSSSEVCAQHCLQLGRPISSSTMSVLKYLSDNLRPQSNLSSPLATCKQPLTTCIYDMHQWGTQAITGLRSRVAGRGASAGIA